MDWKCVSYHRHFANMVLDGLQPLLAKRFKRLWRNNKTFHYKVNLIRYADDFIITGRDKELLENEVKPIVIEFPSKKEVLPYPKRKLLLRTYMTDLISWVSM